MSPALRSGLMVSVGTALIAVPFIAGLGVAAVVTGIAVGALAVALALAGTEPEGRGTLPVSAQAVYDRGLALGLLLVAFVFGLAGEGSALVVFGAAGLAAMLVALVTSYTRPI
jgi:hypothetical protein